MTTLRRLAYGATLGAGFLAGALSSARVVASTDRMLSRIDPERGIMQRGRVAINGVDLMVHIRGEDRANPVLLYIHGGPGSSVDSMAHLFQRPWEEYFTVVHFDQRGVGASPFAEGSAPVGMTFEQHVDDTIAVIEHALAQTGQSRLFLLGHSWGSVLGQVVAQRRPDLLHAYIGIGQVTSWQGTFEETRRLLIEEAERAGKTKIAKALRKVELPLPLEHKPRMKTVAAVQRQLVPFGKGFRAVRTPQDFLGFMATASLTNPNEGALDLLKEFGQAFAMLLPGRAAAQTAHVKMLLDDIHDWDLRKVAGTDFDVPIFYFMGDHDWQTPVTLAREYFDEITAPGKEWVGFANSAHMVPVEEPGRILVELVNRVRPLAQPATAGANTAGG